MTNSSKLEEILSLIKKERIRQDAKFELMPRNRYPSVYLAVLMEEVGEVSRAVLEGDSSNYFEELIQVAAVAVAAAEDYLGGNGCYDVKDVCPAIQHPAE